MAPHSPPGHRRRQSSIGSSHPRQRQHSSAPGYLGDVVLVQASLESDPGFGLQVGDLFDHLQDVGHLLDGNHLLVPQTHPQVADAFNGRLHVRLLVRLHVDVTFDVIGGHHRLDLQWLWGEGQWEESGLGNQSEQRAK